MDCVVVAYLLFYTRLCAGSCTSLSSFNLLNSFLERRKRENTAPTFDLLLAFYPMVGSSRQQQTGLNIYLVLHFSSTDFSYMVYYLSPSIPQ